MPLSALSVLSINETQVSDLRPLLPLEELGEGESAGLWYVNTPASRATPELQRLSQVENNNYAKCYRDTVAYLKTLPPYPEPLPWTIPDAPEVDAPLDPPEPEGLPVLVLRDGKIDIEPGPATEADITDQMKQALWSQLPGALQALARFGNRYPQIGQPAEAMTAAAQGDLAEADLLTLHINLRALQDESKLDASRPEAERLDPDCLGALNQVLRIAPPITIGNDTVTRYETAIGAFERDPQPPTVPEAERQILDRVSERPDLITEELRNLIKTLARTADAGGAAPARRSVSQRVVILLAAAGGTAVSMVAAGTLGEVGRAIATAAPDVLLAMKDAVVAAAQGWGQTFLHWVKDMLTRINNLVP